MHCCLYLNKSKLNENSIEVEEWTNTFDNAVFLLAIAWSNFLFESESMAAYSARTSAQVSTPVKYMISEETRHQYQSLLFERGWYRTNRNKEIDATMENGFDCDNQRSKVAQEKECSTCSSKLLETGELTKNSQRAMKRCQKRRKTKLEGQTQNIEWRRQIGKAEMLELLKASCNQSSVIWYSSSSFAPLIAAPAPIPPLKWQAQTDKKSHINLGHTGTTTTISLFVWQGNWKRKGKDQQIPNQLTRDQWFLSNYVTNNENPHNTNNTM